MTRKTRIRIAAVLVALAAINFLAYVTGAIYLGGDAINGRVVDGRYFVMSHGKYTEVSRAAFDYSRYHTYVTWALHAVAMVAVLVSPSPKRPVR